MVNPPSSTPAKPRRPRADYDSPWKEALEKFLRPFLALCFPHIEADIDWDRGIEFLDKELQKVVRGARKGRGHVDKLVKVWRRSGEETWVLIHLEVQALRQIVFPERMFDYNSLLRQKHGILVVSLAVLADANASWRPDSYYEELWGYRSGIEFPVVKLLDFEARREELETSSNPFAVVILAHLDAQETHRRPQERRRRKLLLVKSLYARGWNDAAVWDLWRLVDWLMVLPDELQTQFNSELEQYEEEREMPYVTSVERFAIRRTRQDSLLEILDARCGEVPASLAERIRGVTDPERLRQLQRVASTVNSIFEFERELGA